VDLTERGEEGSPRRGRRVNHERRSGLAILDTLLFGFAGVSAVWLAYLVLRESIRPNWHVVLLVVFWLLVAYLVLPRLHRVLSYLYLPGYFMGRTRTSDGLLGDPVNLGLLGDEAQVRTALARAGWTQADDVSLASSMRIIGSTVSRRSYPEAPVSPLHLFDRQQDFAYQQEVAGNPAKRHHVRFWRCPEGWLLPGGYAVDWVAAGTYDRSVGLSLMTFQVTHRIAADIDAERDHVVATLTEANPAAEVEVIKNFSTGYHDRNGGGDAIATDGDLPVVDLGSVDAGSPVPPRPASRRDKRPAPTTFGAAVALLRGLISLVAAVSVAFVTDADQVLPSTTLADGPVIIGLVVVAALDLALGLATLLGRNWARVVLMLVSVAAILVAFISTARGGPAPTLGAGLPAVALSILVLLALTSHRARDYATRGHTAPAES
jgi:hypothetical protein